MAIKILTDSSADYEKHELLEKKVLMVPLTVNFEHESFSDGVDISKEEFYIKLENGEYPSSAQPSPEAFLGHFSAAKEAGDELVAILLSSGLSGTVQSAVMAKDMVEYDGIHIIDSLTVVSGLRMLVDIACEMRSNGSTAADIAQMAEELKSRVRIIAIVDTLEYLHKGGRLTKAQAMIGEMANLKILIYIDEEGKVHLLDKCIGRERAVRKLLGYFAADERDPNYPIYFPYSRNAENCKKLFGTVKGRYPDTQELFYNLGPTIGTHIGENAFGLTYILQQ
jgi:DegV family protein with EDD domain